MAKFTIDIVSDTVCPWCYVGYKRLNTAIEDFKAAHPDAEHTFDITWKPYYLNPSAPKHGISKHGYYLSKFGPERTELIIERLSSIGAESGINFSFNGKTGNTRDSHRLIKVAGHHGRQNEVVSELFAAYFENEGDITDHDVLREAAVRAGLDEAVVNEVLESDVAGDVVDREVTAARMKGVTGVPFFTINKRHRLNGAQDPKEFVEIFEEVAGGE